MLSISNQQRHLRYTHAEFIKTGGSGPDTSTTYEDCTYSCFDDNDVVDSKDIEKNSNEVEDNVEDCFDKCEDAFPAEARAFGVDTACIYGCAKGE